ncbi:MAG TPA: hypothetical protein VMU06_20875 [Stellaceae bacterium]|nr:hypothetical protein [Stellaceae bacterium]
MDPGMFRPDLTPLVGGANTLLSLGIVLFVFLLLRGDLRRLLCQVIEYPEGASFYLRSLALVLLATGLSKAILYFDAKSIAEPMEVVWAVTARISGLLDTLLIVLLVFVGMITVLVAVGGTRHGK